MNKQTKNFGVGHRLNCTELLVSNDLWGPSKRNSLFNEKLAFNKEIRSLMKNSLFSNIFTVDLVRRC